MTDNISPAAVSTSDLMRGASRLIRQHLRDLPLIWLGVAVSQVATLIYRHESGLDHAGAHPLSAEIGAASILLLFIAFDGAALRVFLGEREWWRIDRRLLEYVGLVWAGSLLAELGPVSLARVAHSPDALMQLGLSLGQLLASLLVFWMFVRLQLWPIGRLVGSQLTAAGSSDLMRGVFWTYILALFLVFLVISIPGVLLFVTYRRTENVAYGIAAGLFLSPVNILIMAVNARLYQVRVLRQPS